MVDLQVNPIWFEVFGGLTLGGPYLKYDRNLEGEGVGTIAVTLSKSNLDSDVILQSEGGEGQIRPQSCGHT